MSRAPQTAHAVRHRIYSVSVDAKPDVEGVASDNKGTSHKIHRDPAFRLTCASRWRQSQDRSMIPSPMVIYVARSATALDHVALDGESYSLSIIDADHSEDACRSTL